LAALESRIATLSRLIQAAEDKGIDTSCQRVSRTVGWLFMSFIAGDAARTVEDYPREMIDYRILGREEGLRRIRELAAFETRETERVLDRAIEETQRLLADPAANLKVPSGEARQVSIRDGAFCSGGRRCSSPESWDCLSSRTATGRWIWRKVWAPICLVPSRFATQRPVAGTNSTTPISKTGSTRSIAHAEKKGLLVTPRCGTTAPPVGWPAKPRTSTSPRRTAGSATTWTWTIRLTSDSTGCGSSMPHRG